MHSSSLTITNNIVAFNSSGIYKSGSGTPILRYNCVSGNTAYNYSGIADPTGTDGNISADPLLAGTDDLHLSPGSPCIDAGSNAAVSADTLDLDGDGNKTEPIPFDLDGHARFMNDPATSDCRWAPGTCGLAPIVDMGASEYIAGDCDRDGDIDSTDLSVFEACTSGPAVVHLGDCTKADFDHDGDVDQTDFGLLQRCLSGENQAVDPNCTM